jgi:hypothetical protein
MIAPLAACAGLFILAVTVLGYWSGWQDADVGPSAERPRQAPAAEPPALPRAKPGDLTEHAGQVDRATPSVGPPASVAPAIRVFIHHTAGAGNAVPAIQLAAFLEVRGFDVAAIRPVEVQIDRPGVRYFFERDHPDAQRLVEAISGFFAKHPDQAPKLASDFTHSAPEPSQGTVEVWLPSVGTG